MEKSITIKLVGIYFSTYLGMTLHSLILGFVQTIGHSLKTCKQPLGCSRCIWNLGFAEVGIRQKGWAHAGVTFLKGPFPDVCPYLSWADRSPHPVSAVRRVSPRSFFGQRSTVADCGATMLLWVSSMVNSKIQLNGVERRLCHPLVLLGWCIWIPILGGFINLNEPARCISSKLS